MGIFNFILGIIVFIMGFLCRVWGSLFLGFLFFFYEGFLLGGCIVFVLDFFLGFIEWESYFSV